jgi:hypothetical protein
MSRPLPGGTAAPLIDAMVDQLAEQIAARVVEKLRANDFSGYVDQAASPLGRRRHIEAIRSGALRGLRLGRRYLARGEDVDAFIASSQKSPEAPTAKTPLSASSADEVDALAADLGLRRRIASK